VLSLGMPVPLMYQGAHLAIFFIAMVVATLGKRHTEIVERESFQRVVAERTLRCLAEHRAEVAPQQVPKRKTYEQSGASLPSTSPSGKFFRVDEEPHAEEVLKRIRKLGTTEHWLIPSKEVRCMPSVILGRGGFGFVVPGVYHGAPVAVKAPLFAATGDTLGYVFNIAQELRIFRHLCHPNIVLFYGACIEPEQGEIALVLERLIGSVLTEYVQFLDPSRCEAQRFKLAKDVSSALTYLHAQSPPIMHGDLKASNVMVECCSVWPNAKLIDFGLSRLVTTGARPVGGTKGWMAPEILLGVRSPSPSMDIFSFGLLLYFVMTSQQPFLDIPEDDLVRLWGNGVQPSLTWLEETPLLEECQVLCNQCLRLEPLSRPSMMEVRAEVQRMLSGLVPADFYFGLVHPQSPPNEATIKRELRKARRTLRMQDATHQALPGAGTPMASHLRPTSMTGKIISLAATMSSWSCRTHDSCCCHFHSMLEDARQGLATLQQCKCKADVTVDSQARQCQRCGLILFPDSGDEACCCETYHIESGGSGSNMRQL